MGGWVLKICGTMHCLTVSMCCCRLQQQLDPVGHEAEPDGIHAPPDPRAREGVPLQQVFTRAILVTCNIYETNNEYIIIYEVEQKI